MLVPVFRDARDDPRIVLILRKEGGIHGGQIAFPGGKPSPADRSMLETAMREAREEVGIAAETTEVLESLPVMETVTTGFRIHPFLARIAPPEEWRPDEREIAEVLETRIADLARPEARGQAVERFPGRPEPRQYSFIRVGPHRLWGVTYRILEPLLPRLLSGEWRI